MNTELSSDFEARHEAHERWVREVRDPAERNSEGYRALQVDGATAEYAIAPLPGGEWAFHTSLDYHCGDCHGSAMPWQRLPSREECVALFVERARYHFGLKLHLGSATDQQRKAQQAMLQLLGDGLFGFVEPAVDPERTRHHAEIAELTNRLWRAHEAARQAASTPG